MEFYFIIKEDLSIGWILSLAGCSNRNFTKKSTEVPLKTFGKWWELLK